MAVSTFARTDHLKPVILIADDEELVRLILTEYLGDAGFDVIPTASADEALSVIDSNAAVDLVLTDVNMPGMSGDSFARWLVSHRPGLPVILTSGAAQPFIEAQGRRFIPKPYCLDDVERQIRELLH